MSDLLPGVSQVMAITLGDRGHELVHGSRATFFPGCRLLSQPARPRSQAKHLPSAHWVSKELQRPTKLQRGGNNEVVSLAAIGDSVLLQRRDLYPRTVSLWDR